MSAIVRRDWLRGDWGPVPPPSVASSIERATSRLPADPRQALADAARARGETLVELSRMLRRWDGYLARFVRNGRPRALEPADHQLLADHFGVSARGLGVRDLWVSS